MCGVTAEQTESLFSHFIGYTAHILLLVSRILHCDWHVLISALISLETPSESLRKTGELINFLFFNLQRSVHLANKISQRQWGRCLVMPQTQKAEAPSRSVGDFRRGFSSEKSPDILFHGGCVNKGTSWSFFTSRWCCCTVLNVSCSAGRWK